ncbi:MAG: ACP S-malonyltransferase [Firmicutes bacterium]|nr:ACP S-malonyltransferase [Bacillota bacterium]
MTKTAFLYAGQGSQFAGMGKDLYEEYPAFRSLLDRLDPGFDAKQMMFEDPRGLLSDTRYTQPCMALFAMGVTQVLKENGIEPQAAAGLSLGEYGALYAAGVFDEETCCRLVTYRGKVMAEAAEKYSCAMSAVLGLSAQQVEQCCRTAEEKGFVCVANYNCPGQYVISGEEPAVAAAEEAARAMGARRCVRLAVSAPFHTPFLKEAGERLGEFLQPVRLQTPRIPVALNVTGSFYKEGQYLKALLKQQVSSSVRFEDCLQALLQSGVDRFIEIGPGDALSGFCRRKAKEMGILCSVVTLQNADDLDRLLNEQEK